MRASSCALLSAAVLLVWCCQVIENCMSGDIPLGVIPSAPGNLSLRNLSSESVSLQWSVPFSMHMFPPGLVHRVRYQSEWDTPDHWHEQTTSLTTARDLTHVIDINNLTHANTMYEFKITAKSAAARDTGDEMLWSPPASISVKTKPAVPGAAPKTDVGSFEVSGGLTSRFVYLYWQHIPENLRNGDQFQYKVYRVDEQGNNKAMEPIEISKSYSKFKGVDMNSHKFVVVSSNREGRSVDQSTIYVPSRRESPPEPLDFTKTDFGKGIYKLTWRPPPEENPSIVNYTIFWCDNERDRPYQCTGFLDWVHVPSGVHVKTVTVPEDKIYQFAISANSKNGSSGMVWASCSDTYVMAFDPCTPNPCRGYHNVCYAEGRIAVCGRQDPDVDSPPSGRPECVVNTDCPRLKACVASRCVNPCKTLACGQDALCDVMSHEAMCKCGSGYIGDPLVLCLETRK